MTEDSNTAASPARRAALAAARAGLVGALALALGAGALSQTLAPSAAKAQLLDNVPHVDLRAGLQDFSSRSKRGEFEEGELRTVVVKVDGTTRELVTRASTLGQVFRQYEIVVGADDVVSAPLSGPVPSEVTILRAGTSTVTEQRTQDFKRTEVASADLAKGETKVQTKGVAGKSIATFEVKVAGGKEVARTLLAETVTQPRVDEVVLVGTKERTTMTKTPPFSGDAVALGQSLAAGRGWTGEQWTCLYNLWMRESRWNPFARNSSSGAYGIPQALPGSKMASHGADWATNPATQISWGLDYIKGRYSSPCGAWASSQSRGWY